MPLYLKVHPYWPQLKGWPARYTIQAFEHVKEQEIEARLWQQYLAIYPWMDKNTFVPYQQFYDENRGIRTQRLPKASEQESKAILDKAKQIRDKAAAQRDRICERR